LLRIASIGTTQNAVNAYGVKAVNIETLMRVTYKILDINGGEPGRRHYSGFRSETTDP